MRLSRFARLSLVLLPLFAFAPVPQWMPVATVDGDPVMRGLPRDAIPAIHEPRFVRGDEARFMRDEEYIIGVSDGTTAKAYSTWHLNGHEIVNDTLGGEPIAVTWCPLCFTGIVYSRVVGNRTLAFGVSGMLWRENLVMYDLQTESWWSQATGQAIHGELQGTTLRQVPATMVTWKAWRERHPDTLVLEKRSARDRMDTYARYHASADLGVTRRVPRTTGGVAPKTWVVGFRIDEQPYAVELDQAAAAGVMLAEAGRVPVIVAAANDGSGARVFLAGEHQFASSPRGIRTVLTDAATASDWDPFEGRAVSGRLAGTTLEEVPSSMSYWFAWRAFFPQTTWIAAK